MRSLPRLPRLPILTGLLVSVLLHGLVLVPQLVNAMTPAHVIRMPARFDPEDFTPPGETDAPPLEPELGLDRETPSSLTWVGYEEYREHLAELAAVEQAAFRIAPPPGGAPAESSVDAAPPGTEPTDATVTEAEVSEAAGSVLDASDLIAIRAVIEAMAFATAPNDGADDSQRDETDAQPSPTLEEILARIQATTSREGTNPRPPAPTAPTAPPGPGPGATDGTEPDVEERPGETADKESDASSVIDVPLDQIKNGQPVARAGLELQPRRPKFTDLTVLSASPGNPTVQISFNGAGVPVIDGTKILISSGDRRVDHAIESSLFRWRASGKELERLVKGETKAVRLKIILNPRAR